MRATTANTAPASFTAPIVTPFPARQDTPLPSSVAEEFIAEQALLADTVHELRVHGLDALQDWELDEPASDFATSLMDSHV